MITVILVQRVRVVRAVPKGAFADVAAAEAYAETVKAGDNPGRLADWYPMRG